MQDDRSKRCTRCGETKPLDQFSPRGDGKGRDGLGSHCKTCKSAKATAWYWQNKDRRQEYVKANLPVFREQSRKRRADPVSAARMRAQERDRRARDPLYPAKARMDVSRRLARKRKAFIEDVHPLVVLERHDGVCGICGEDVDPFDFHVDHIIPLSRGGEHSYRNTQPAHPVCNIRKGAKVP